MRLSSVAALQSDREHLKMGWILVRKIIRFFIDTS